LLPANKSLLIISTISGVLRGWLRV
jgi:hypothetical protein